MAIFFQITIASHMFCIVLREAVNLVYHQRTHHSQLVSFKFNYCFLLPKLSFSFLPFQNVIYEESIQKA